MKRVLSLVTLIALVTGCSSGGGSGSIPAQTPLKAAPQSVGTSTLTIKFPATFGVVKKTSVKGARPQFVNPVTSNFLDVYVDQILVLLPGGPGSDTVQISNANGDGTQTLSIPQYSTGINDVLVIERDPSNDILAIGQAFTNSVNNTPGSANSDSINMAMNLASFGYSTDGVNASPLVEDQTVCLGTSPGSSPIQFVGVDPSGGFTLTSNAGVGGLAALTVSPGPVTSTDNPPSNIASTLGGTFSLIYDSAGDGVGLSVAALNPAYAVTQGMEIPDQNVLSNYGGSSPFGTSRRVDGVEFFAQNTPSCD